MSRTTHDRDRTTGLRRSIAVVTTAAVVLVVMALFVGFVADDVPGDAAHRCAKPGPFPAVAGLVANDRTRGGTQPGTEQCPALRVVGAAT